METLERQVLSHQHVPNPQRMQALQTWQRVTKTELKQINGQRKYGGPPQGWDGPPPGSCCEVFISHIPRDAYEDLLIPLFTSVGPLWEFRLMMNFSGQNRGFAYAKYGSPAVASRAISQLNGFKMGPGSYLTLCLSTEKRNLCIMGLPISTKAGPLLKLLQKMTEGVERVSLKAGSGIQGTVAIVVYSSHHTASMSKKMLTEAFLKEYALKITVQWQASPQADRRSPGKKWLPKSASPPARPLDPPPGFCRAVGGPTAPKSPFSSSASVSVSSSTPTSTQTGPVPCAASPEIMLHMMCKAAGLGEPQYEFHINHCGPNGFLYISFKVEIPNVTNPFRGITMILPPDSADTLLERAKQAAAHQVLQSIQP